MTGIGRFTEAVAGMPTAGVGGKLGQVMVDGKSRSGCPVLTGRLVEDMGKVRGDRFLAEDQLPGNLGVGQPFDYQAQHLYLACGQSSRIGVWRSCGRGRRWTRHLSLASEDLLGRPGSSLRP